MPEETRFAKADTASLAPDDFVALVRDALAHLYDIAHLERHPLVRLVAASLGPGRDTGKALRALLFDTVEQLNPSGCPDSSDKEWRPYTILTRRYVDGSSIEETVDELGISLRQFHREHTKALQAVAAILWRRWQPDDAELPHETNGNDLRQEMDCLGVALEPLDLASLVGSIMRPAQALAGNLHVQFEVDSSLPPVSAWADSTLARQALLGALGALIRAHPLSIRVVWGSAERSVLLELRIQPPLPLLSDSGQEDSLDQRLVAVAELMRAQGGRLDTITHSRCLHAVRLTFGKAQSTRVLLIDDNERMLQLFERYLTAEGYNVGRASDAEQALQSIEHEAPQAIILDVMMRNIDGWQLLERLRAMPSLRSVPIVVCSVLNEADLAYALGAQFYLKKPVTQHEMLSALRQVLDGNNPVAPPLEVP